MTEDGSPDGPDATTGASHDSNDAGESHDSNDDAPAEAAGEPGTAAAAGPVRSRLPSPPTLTDDRTLRAVVGITAVALVLRLFALGARTAHWDEGRVAFWALRYAETGYFEYRAIVHGPFLFQVDRWLFALLGPSDFVARLPVAVVGGLLPLVALLLRDRLRRSEVLALALLLAANPLLLYYSRFMRNDVLVAAFCTFALAYFVRTYDRRSPRALYAGSALLALGFTTKENALLYLLCWGGALALLADHRLLDAVRASDQRGAGDAGESDGHPLPEDSDPTPPRPVHDGTWLRRVARSLDPAVAVPAVVFLATAPPLVNAFGYGTPAAALLVAVGAAAHVALLSASPRADPLRYAALVPMAVVVVAGLAGVALPVGGAGVWYLLAWLLAGLLVVDERLFATREGRPTVPPALGASAVFLAVVVFFYAPRAGPTAELGLWRALANPTLLPALLEEALVGSWLEFQRIWGADPLDPERLAQFPGRMRNMLGTTRTTAGAIAGFAVVGTLVDRYSGGGPRDLVAFAGYWGAASAVGYPYATDIWAPWVAVHAVVPLAVPAAVGVAAVYRLGVRSWRVPDAAGGPEADPATEPATDGGRSPRPTSGASAGSGPDGLLDWLGGWARLVTVACALVLVVTAVPVAVTGVDVAYLNSADHERVLGGDAPNEYALQWAQPGNGLKRTLATVERVSRVNDDGAVDVLYVGSETPGGDPVLYMPAEARCQRLQPVHEPADPCNAPDQGSWHSRLPLPWYLEAYDARTDATPPGADLSERESFPPVVIAHDWDRGRVDTVLPATYQAHTHRFKLWGEHVVVFVDESAVPE